MTKPSQKTRLARLDKPAKRNDPRLKRPSEPIKPMMAHTDFMFARWINSLNAEDRALWDSQYPPKQPDDPDARVTPQAREKQPKLNYQPSTMPHKSGPKTTQAGRYNFDISPTDRTAKILAQQQLAAQNYWERQRKMVHIDAKIRAFVLTLPAHEQDEIRNGWKKSIRPYKKPE